MNPRWIAYTEHLRETDGGEPTNHGYMIWIQGKWRAFRKERGLPENQHTSDETHAAFDAWLTLDDATLADDLRQERMASGPPSGPIYATEAF